MPSRLTRITAGAHPSSGPEGQTTWERIDRLLEGVLDLPRAEQRRAVERHGAGDPGLRAILHQLLDADEAMSRFLERGSGPAAGGEPVARIGDRIGPFRLTGLLGTGGMGWVFAAERVDGQFEQSVAIKILSLPPSAGGSDGAASGARLIDRMRQEREILSRLEHPHVARLVDGGTTSDGRPYLVLEKLEGHPIDRYCRERELPIEQRLGLFRQLCSAVQFAHAHLLIHRDLKPSNVLVTDAGEAKLLDFGIAKLLDLDGGAPDLLTRTGESPMTLRYASPEQVRRQPLTIACDIYGLGVLLYELLTDISPYGEARGTYELLRAICEGSPEPPSRAVRRSAANASERSERSRRLDGDLDAIVLKALEKDPRRRYPSAEALAEDLDRHARNLPVEARKPTFAYRIRTFVRRHRAGVAFAAFLALLNLGYVAALALQAKRVEQAAEDSRAALDFMVWAFGQADASETGRQMSGKEILDQGAAQIASVRDRPWVHRRLQLAIAEAYLGLGLAESAAEMLDAPYAGAGAPDATEMDPELRVRQARQRAEVTYARGDFPRAADRARQTLELAENTLGRDHAERHRSAQLLAAILTRSGAYEEAEALLHEVGDALAGGVGAHHPLRLAWMRDLGLLAQYRGRFAEAERIFAERLRILKTLYGDDHLKVGLALAGLGSLALFQGDDARAVSLLRQAGEIIESVLGEAHPSTLVNTNNLATAMSNLGDLAPAEQIYRRMLALRRELLGSDHPAVAITRNNLASVLRRRGAFREAEHQLIESLAIFEKADDAASAAWIHCGLGRALDPQGRTAEAADRYRRCQAILEQVGGQDHVNLAWPLIGLAEVAMRDGRPAAAEPLARRAVELRRAAPDVGAERIAVAVGVLGDCLRSLGRLNEAEPLLLERYELYRTLLPAGHQRRIEALEALLAVDRSAGRVVGSELRAQQVAEERAARDWTLGFPQP